MGALARIGAATVFAVALAAPAAPASAAPATSPPPPANPRTLVVGVKVAPPFVIENPGGSYSGISVELWKRIAGRLGRPYRFEKTDLAGLLQGAHDGSYEIGVGAVTVTAKRERLLDFSHPFYTSGLGIAVTQQHGMAWLAVVQKFFSWQFLSIIIVLALVLLAFGFLIWLFEHKRNPEMFGGRPHHGIGASFWWAAVTMTTVGYGDLAPRTLGGRIIGLIWMFAAIIIISSFTAAIATSLTVNQLNGPIQGPGDLKQRTVGVLPDSTAAAYLRTHDIAAKDYPDLQKALAALADRRVDAVVYDAPMLRYYVNEQFADQLLVLPRTFQRQDYALIMPLGSSLRKPVDEQLLTVIQSPDWQTVLDNYLGRQASQ